MVLEAILVALLVLTAILFFTNAQRPSTGASEGGLDLAQVAADTLQIMQQRSFTVSGQAQTFNGWITNATRGDAATVSTVDTFIKQVLPTGAHYALRLDNGVSRLQVLPANATEVPRNARAAELATMPSWKAFRNDTVSSTMRTVIPGDVVDATDALVSGTTYRCFEAPYGNSKAPGGVEWSSRWVSSVQSTAPTTNGKDVASVLGSKNQIPRDVPFGKWKLSSGAAVSSHCTSGTITYLDVVPIGQRVLTVSTTSASTTLTAASGSYRFSSADAGLAVSGSGIPAGARLASVQSGSQATLSAAATGTGSIAITLPVDPTFMPYGIQLVVWFGA
jgi:hypothetical protein